MSELHLRNVLTLHSTRTRNYGGRLQAEDIYTVHRRGRHRTGRKWVTVTGWSRERLREWLGY